MRALHSLRFNIVLIIVLKNSLINSEMAMELEYL